MAPQYAIQSKAQASHISAGGAKGSKYPLRLRHRRVNLLRSRAVVEAFLPGGLTSATLRNLADFDMASYNLTSHHVQRPTPLGCAIRCNPRLLWVAAQYPTMLPHSCQ